MMYFAYGANLDKIPMCQRCPGAALVGQATLPDYRLVAMREGWLSVAPENDNCVHGLLWQLQPTDWPPLDTYEGLEDGLYSRNLLQVHPTELVSADPVEATVYIGNNSGPGCLRPEYATRVERAAAQTLGATPAAQIRALA